MNFYISRQGQTLGPYSDEQVRQQLSTGVISPDDLACPVGAQQWLPLRQVLPSAPNQPAPPPPVAPPPAAYQTAGYPPAAYQSPEPPRRSWLWPVLVGVFVLLAAIGIYLILPGKVTGHAFRTMDGPSGKFKYLPAGASVALYKEDNAYSQTYLVKAKLREMKAYIEANQGHIDEDKLRLTAACLPTPIYQTTTDSGGNFTVEVPKVGIYALVIWDHATVNGTTATNAWLKVEGMDFMPSKQDKLDYDYTINLDY